MVPLPAGTKKLNSPPAPTFFYLIRTPSSQSTCQAWLWHNLESFGKGLNERLSTWLTYGMSEGGIQLNSLMWKEPARRGCHHSLCKDAELYEWRNRAKGKQASNQPRVDTYISLCSCLWVWLSASSSWHRDFLTVVDCYGEGKWERKQTPSPELFSVTVSFHSHRKGTSTGFTSTLSTSSLDRWQ